MEEIILKAKLRKELGKKINAGRRAGMIPAVLYGKGAD
ncbi:MAG: 50S ribosomal protein L25, partial [Candidatus Moranbacteria bacterium CG_4_9_14_3_um_filter_40_7]